MVHYSFVEYYNFSNLVFLYKFILCKKFRSILGIFQISIFNLYNQIQKKIIRILYLQHFHNKVIKDEISIRIVIIVKLKNF